jgi:hypothetical protein
MKIGTANFLILKYFSLSQYVKILARREQLWVVSYQFKNYKQQTIN